MAAILIFTQPRPQGLLAKLKTQKTLGSLEEVEECKNSWGVGT